MTMKTAVRWRPPNLRSALETKIEPGNADATPPTSPMRVEILEAVVYDDAQVGTASNPYVPGAPESERYISVVDSAVIRLAVSAFAGKSNAEAQALWDAAKQAQITEWQNQADIGSYVQAAVGAYLSPLQVIG